MERSLLAIVSLMVFQIFEALYINCELGSEVIRKASFLFDSKYKEYKDIGILYLSVLNVSMLQWYQCATGSKILTEPEPDRIGIILAGTGPELDRITSQKKLTGFDRIGRIDRIFTGFLPDFYRILKTLIINLQVTNINLHGSFNFEI